jgi:hypothetical protein
VVAAGGVGGRGGVGENEGERMGRQCERTVGEESFYSSAA